MEKNVYPDKEVGQYMNAKFVSLKLQMDTGKNDDENVKMLYSTARDLEKEYSITELPTYFFFSPDGNLVHKETGSKSIKEFMSLLEVATNPDKQLYTLARKANIGTLSYDVMPALAKNLKDHKEDKLALDIAKKYMYGYLDKLSEDAFCKKENMQFLRSFARMISSKDRAFRLWYKQSDKIDKIMSNEGYARTCANYIISREEIQPALDQADKTGELPDWNKIQKTIERKYDKNYAVYNVLNIQVNWYRSKKYWENYIGALMRKYEFARDEFNRYGWMGLNDLAWTVCVHSNNKQHLNTALGWIDMAIPMDKKINTAMMDTKANILYRLGRKEEAILLETQVVEVYKRRLNSQSVTEGERQYLPRYVNAYQGIVDKMKDGEAIELMD
jgi:hypothetical protein